KPHRIDVHHHISPPSWLDAVKKVKRDNPPMANWSPQRSLDDMDQAGIATAIVSPTTPQVNFLDHDKDAAARIARESNEYTKKLMSDHPARFGLSPMRPLPHIDASLEEIAYSSDTLKADGIGMMTRLGRKMARLPAVRPGMGGAQPPQGHGLHPSDRRQLLRQPGAGHRGSDHRVRRRHHPHHREPDLQRHLPALQGHQLDLLPRRRRVDGGRGAPPAPD